MLDVRYTWRKTAIGYRWSTSL